MEWRCGSSCIFAFAVIVILAGLSLFLQQYSPYPLRVHSLTVLKSTKKSVSHPGSRDYGQRRTTHMTKEHGYHHLSKETTSTSNRDDADFIHNVTTDNHNSLGNNIHMESKEEAMKHQCDGFGFAGYYTDHMVLQRQPWRAVVWGYSTPSIGSHVVIHFAGKSFSSVVKQDKGGQATWQVTLDPQEQPGPFEIQATSGDCTASLRDVLFGDVWVCSGQSNMEYELYKLDNPEPVLEEVPHFNQIRVIQVPIVFPAEEQSDISVKWTVPTRGNIDEFSALCWLYGRGLYQKLGVPIGLVHSSVAGTRIQAWSSPAALQTCYQQRDMHPAVSEFNVASSLWNGMIHPFTRMSIYGAIWYQGEENRYGTDTDLYACSLSSMIADWRKTWYQNTEGATDSVFPFGQVQLAPWNDTNDLTGVRWLQTAGRGYTPNNFLPRVFTAVAIDLPDLDAPYHSIHPRYKRQIATRLLYGAYVIAYGLKDTGPFQGPIPTSYLISTSNITLVYDDGSAELEIRDKDGFEVCCSEDVKNNDCLDRKSQNWRETVISDFTKSSVVLSNPCGTPGTPGAAQEIRYDWSNQPCTLEHCAVYTVQNTLPAPPYKIVLEQVSKPQKT